MHVVDCLSVLLFACMYIALLSSEKKQDMTFGTEIDLNLIYLI